MATQYVDFETTGDTGQNDPTSIEPVENGEAATAAVFQRPSENLRVRTETLKSQVEQLKYLSDADRALVLTASGDISWAGLPTGTFTASSDVTLKPFMSPATSTPATVTFTLEGTKTMTFTTSMVGASGRPRAYNGANELSVQFVGIDGGTLSSAIEGLPNNKFVITYNSNAVTGTTSDDLLLFLSSGLPATQLAALRLVVSFSATDTTVITPPSTEQRLSGAADAEKHVISASAFSTFFTDVNNTLTEGDVLCVWYDDLVLPSGGGRRQSIDEAPENIPPLDGAAVSSSSLFLLRRYPERLPGALPVATVQNGKLIFVNNRVYGAGESGPLVSSGSSYQGSAPDAFADGATLPASSFEDALDTLVNWLGSSGATPGGERLGVKAVAGSPVFTSAGKLSTALSDIVSGVNLHINDSTDAHAASAISAPAVPSSPDSLATTTVSGQLGELLTVHNAHLNDATAAHAGTAIGYTPTTPVDLVGATTVSGALDTLDDEKASKNLTNTFTKKNTFQPSTSNTNAIDAYGNGTGYAVYGEGKSGVYGQASANSGHGLVGRPVDGDDPNNVTGGGYGIVGVGGDNGSYGHAIVGVGNAAVGGDGLVGTGAIYVPVPAGSSRGVTGVGLSTGVYGLGHADTAASGISGQGANATTGNTPGGIGVYGKGGLASGTGTFGPGGKFEAPTPYTLALDVVGADNWDLTTTEGDFRIGDTVNRIKMGIAVSGGGAGDATIAAQGGINKLSLGAGSTTSDQKTIRISGGKVGIGQDPGTDQVTLSGGITTGGNITSGGNVSVPNTSTFKYASTKSGALYLSGGDLKYQVSAGTFGYGGPALSYNRIGVVSTNASLKLWTSFRLPAGAVITSITGVTTHGGGGAGGASGSISVKKYQIDLGFGAYTVNEVLFSNSISFTYSAGVQTAETSAISLTATTTNRTINNEFQFFGAEINLSTGASVSYNYLDMVVIAYDYTTAVSPNIYR